VAYLENEWWGYLHINGSIQVKRVFYDYELCIQKAISSPFIKRVFYKFEADSRDEALNYIRNQVQ
jgi:hypothetical protein